MTDSQTCSYFRPESHSNTSEVSDETIHPNLTLNDATSFLLEKVPPSYQQMLASNFSVRPPSLTKRAQKADPGLRQFGFERDEAQLIRNNDDHSKWSNPLEVQLPKAPSMTIYCLYGVGKETERAYFYQQGAARPRLHMRTRLTIAATFLGGYEHDETPTVNTTDSRASSLDPVCLEPNCTDSTPRPPLDLPLQRRVWIDGSVTMDEKSVPKVRSGVVFNDGDGTVSLLSLGSMCVEGWKVRLAALPTVSSHR